MNQSIRRAVLTVFVVAQSAATTPAGEIQLRPEAQCAGAIVRLGDVAEVFESDAAVHESLAALELFPAPTPGQTRRVTAREVCDELILRGVNLLEHRLSGSNVVRVSGPAATSSPAVRSIPSESAAQRAAAAVRVATLRHVAQLANDTTPWTVRFTLSDEQVHQVMTAPALVQVSGGRSPVVGPQQLTATIRDSASGQTYSFQFAAELEMPPAVVMVVHPINRGETVKAADVELRYDQPGSGSGNLARSMDDVVGLEALRTLAPGQYVDRDSLRRPLLVRRGDPVTVTARSSGIRVRTTARAREDGSVGDLIQVESMLNRETFLARVTGAHEVEVYARAAEAGAPRFAVESNGREGR